MISFSFYRRVYKFISRQLFRILFSSKFKYFGNGVSIVSPEDIQGEEYIELKDNVIINSMPWLLALKIDDNKPILTINEGVNIGRFAHIVSVRNVLIEKNVLIADKVYISDNIHEYENIDIPIKEQAVKFKGEVIIGENSWIGENVSIIGVSIGKHCIIGSNAVVTKNIPDYSVVVGIPARVIKRYDFQTNKWKKTDAKGEFLSEV